MMAANHRDGFDHGDVALFGDLHHCDILQDAHFARDWVSGGL